MERNFKNFFGLIGEKAKGSGVVSAFEQSREGQPKAYIPNFFYKPPFGYPRYKNLVYQRQLASSVYVDMCTTAIMDEVVSIPWGIVAEDKDGNKIIGKEKEMQIVEDFFMNPNTNPESWETIVKMMLSDLLEINSGIMVKVFNSFGKMVEIVARDGISFTKNPDVYGMFTNRADIILMKNIYDEKDYDSNNGYPLLQGFLTPDQAQEKGAYFQYGFSTGAKPIPYGKREIVWFEKKVRTDDIYGRSPMDVLQKTVQTLIYAVEHNLEYFSDNSIPPGVLGLDGLSTEDMKAFGQQWTESQKKTDDLGNWKKVFHKLAMVNRTPKFERLGFTNQELELIESQKWWAKMVWSIYGLTATELGFTEDAKGSANQIVQTSAAKRRIIYPLLRLIEYYVNTEIVSEFGFEGIKYKYKIFDVDEETKKWSLYKLQTDSNLKTVNEIRALEGLDSLEGGDETSTMRTERNQQADRQLIDPNQQEVNQINQDSQDDRDQMNGKTLFKAIRTDSQPNEEMGERKLKNSIVELLKENKKNIIDVLESQTKKEPLMIIKGIDDIPKMIKKIFSFFTFKKISDEIINSKFSEGWDYSEKKIDRNVQYNEKALEFLQEYTFGNIKGMTEEIANDLKAELERGIINGEGINKLKGRVERVFNVGENRAEMIARTETNRAENNGKLLAMKGSGLEMMKKWITHKDDRTSPICRRLDGQIVKIDEDFEDSSGWEGQSPPSHVNCRSTLVFISKEEYEQSQEEKKEVKKDLKEQIGISFNTSPSVQHKVTKALLDAINEKKEEEQIDQDIDLKLKEEDMKIKKRKQELLKKLEGEIGRD